MNDVVLDGEELALRAMARNASRIRVTLGAVSIVTGLAVGIVAYWILRAMFFEAIGVNFPAITVILAFVIPCGMALLLGRAISRGLIRARQEAWITELAQQHGVPADRLRESAFIL